MSQENSLKACPACLPPQAEDAWNGVGELTIDARLIDDTHHIVLLRSCPACGQRFVSVFAELIDWADGEDPQFWTVLPITEQEAASLSAADEAGVISMIYGLGPDRRSLSHDHPKGEDAKSFWSTGIKPRPHD
jgi:hypothetical protein